MQDYVIFTDSTADLPQDLTKELDINVIPMELTLDGENYFEDLNLDFKKFYNDLKVGQLPKTTCINSAKYIDCFEPYLKDNKDVLYICLSSALSKTYECAQMAANELNKKYSKKLIVVDSKSASLGQGLLVYYAAQKKKLGEGIDQVKTWLEENRIKLCHWFTVDDLFHLKRGGRVSATAAAFGTMLNVKPILNINNEGFLTPKGKIRGRKSSLLALVNEMEKTFIPSENEIIFISHANSIEDAEFVAQTVREKFNIENIIINYIGPSVGSHTGSGTIALFFIGESR